MGLSIKEDDLFETVEVESEIADGFEVEQPDLDDFGLDDEDDEDEDDEEEDDADEEESDLFDVDD
jgi:ribonuclease E